MCRACAIRPRIASGACTDAVQLAPAMLWPWGHRLAVLILLLLAPLVHALSPQTRLRDYAQDRWGVEDGLPQLSVLSITEDAQGYLWVGTQNGLARFDGLRFTVFDRARTGIDTTFIAHALLDDAGQLWFGTPRGVLRMAAGQLEVVDSEPAQLSVNALAQGADGRILVGTDLGLFVVEGGAVRISGLVGEAVYGLHTCADGSLLVGLRGAVVQLEDGAERQRWTLPDAELRVQRLAQTGALWWLGTQDGLWQLESGSGALSQSQPALRGQSVEALLVDGDGQLWVGASAALLRRTADGLWAEAGVDEALERPWVHALYEDRRGDLWLGTHRESLVRWANSAVRWLGSRDGLHDDFVWSVLPDASGGAWVGTSSGLQQMDAAGRFAPDATGGRLPQAHVYNLAYATDGRLLVGTRGGLAVRGRDGVLTVPPELAPLAREQINALAPVGDAIWIGTLGGLYRWQDGGLAMLGPPPGSADARIRSILPLDQGALLLGTEGGVRQFRDGRIEAVPWAAPLEQQFVSRLKWLRPNLLGIATLDSGLGLMQDGKLLLLTPEHGLPTRNGWTLDVLGDYLYVGSINGVYRLALDALPDPRAPPALLRVDAEQVIRGRGRARSHRLGCCNGGADARSARVGEQLVYASTNGVVLVDTARIPREPPAPRAVIEELRNSGAAWLPDRVPVLAGASRDVAIDYAGLSLREPEQIEFRYRLHGYNDDWQDVGTRRTAFFTHLPPGAYRFEVQARHPFGEWHPQPGVLAFEIPAQWYESLGVRLMVPLLLTALLLWRWRAGIRNFRRREVELERAVAERTAQLAAANAQLKVVNQQLEQESRTDPLTGLSNRRALFDSGLKRQGVIAMIDLDHFKRVNDQYGHAVGDQVLMEFAVLLRSEIRPGDLLARWGGEEFLVLLARMQCGQATGWAERVRQRIAAHGFILPDRSVLKLSVSIGLAGHGENWQQAQELADHAMYQAKRAGRNCVVSA